MKDLFPRVNPVFKGISLAFLATLGMANVYVFSKAALLEVSYFQFQFFWFGFALIWILPFLYYNRNNQENPEFEQVFPDYPRDHWNTGTWIIHHDVSGNQTCR